MLSPHFCRQVFSMGDRQRRFQFLEITGGVITRTQRWTNPEQFSADLFKRKGGVTL